MSENVETVKSYVIPMYSLLGICINTDNPENVNSIIRDLMIEAEQSREFKTILGEVSQKLTLYFSSRRENTVGMFIPTSFIPVKEVKESEIVVDFIEQANKIIQDRLNEESAGESK